PRNIHFLADGEIAILTTSGIQLTDFDGAPLPLKIQRIAWDPIQAEKAGYKHFMLKEIYEQPRAIRDTILGRVSASTGQVFLAEMDISDADLRAATQVTIAACGTSWHAGLAGKFMIERMARLRSDVDYASEYRYRNPIPDPKSIGLLTTNSGPEIGVASTKAFTAQLTALFLLALKLGQVRGTISKAESLALVDELNKIPAKLDAMLNLNIPGATGGGEGSAALIPSSSLTPNPVILSEARSAQSKDPDASRTSTSARTFQPDASSPSYPGPDRRAHPRLSLTDQCCELAKIFSTANDFLFLGRGIHYPIALEGALKLKEISYIHAEGYPAGEMKHGPNALIDETLPVVCIATQDPTDPTSVLKYEKTLSNIQEVTARSGRVIAIAIEGDQTIAQLVEHVIYIPQCPELLLPILEVVPLQLLAYHIAVRRA